MHDKVRRVPEDGDDLAKDAGGPKAAVFRFVPHGQGSVRFTTMSDGMGRLMGVAPKAALADPAALLQRIVDDDRDRVVAELCAAATDSTTLEIDFHVLAPDGSRRLLMLCAAPDSGSDGFVGILVDVTARMERCLAGHEMRDGQIARQKEIIELLHDIAATANEAPDAHTAMSRCLQRLCDHGNWPIGHVFTVDEADTKRLVPTDLWYLDDLLRFAAWDSCTRTLELGKGAGLPGRVFASGQPEWVIDVTIDPDFLRGPMARKLGIRTGFAIPVRIGMEVVAVMEFYSTEIIPPDPLLVQALTHIGIQIGRVVERDRATRDIKVVGELAQAASRAKSNFLANMSHELRTPLNAIIGFSETMLAEFFGPLANERYSDYVRHIHSAGHYLLHLVNDILDLSRIEARRLILDDRPLDVAAILEISTEMLRAKADSQGVTLTVAGDHALPAVKGDELRLKQVMLNLLSNAIRATPPGGTVTMSASLDLQKRVLFTIADTGCGMTPEELATAFRAFESNRTAYATRADEGIGLGLPLAKALVELHGGMLEIRSEKGKGTVATVRLPPNRVLPRHRAVG